MKNFAKLIIFFSLTYIITFIIAILLSSISAWIELARIISDEARMGEDLAKIAWKSIPAAFYISILLAIAFSAKEKMPLSMAIISIIILGCVFTGGISLAIERTGVLKPALKPVPMIQAGPGLMLPQSDDTVILLKRNSDLRGSRVVSISGKPLIYQEIPLGPNNTIISLPPLPIGGNSPWFIESASIDFTLAAGELKTRYDESFYLFAAYVFAIILLLSSLRFLMELSNWPLANIFFGALVFRLVLSLEVFLNSRETNNLIGSFLAGKVPSALITPLVFGALSVLILIYTILTGIARGGFKSRKNKDV